MGKYFTIAELTKSDTANKKNIDNSPSKQVEANLNQLITNILDPLREAYGEPIIVSSGYRCPTLNKAVGGASSSQHCFSSDTEILTNNGWKTYKNINLTDQVLSYNLDNQVLEYKPIQKVISYEYEGPLLCAENQHISFAVTDEHRMLCRYSSHKYKKKNTRNISVEGQKYFDSLKTNNDIYHIELVKDLYGKRRIFKCSGISAYQNDCDINLLRFCMAVISDGFLYKKSKKDGTYTVSYGFNLKKERDKTELEDILNSLGWNYKKRYSYTHEKQGTPGVYQYFINSTVAKDVINIIGLDKKIPKWFLLLKPEYLKQLIVSYAKFDGTLDTRNNNSGITIFSKDKENIDLLQQMCILCGWRSVIKTFTDLKITIHGHTNIMPVFFHLYITQNSNESRVNEDKWYTKFYKGIVWCVNNENTTLIIRRNGKVSIQGNCLGQAADIHSKSNTREDNKKIFDLIKSLKLPFDQLINEYNYKWVHVSYSSRNRRQILNIK